MSSLWQKVLGGVTRRKREAEQLEAKNELLESRRNERETEHLVERAEQVAGHLRAHEQRNHFAERIDRALYGKW